MATKRKLEDFLSYLYGSTYMPMHYYKEQELVSIFPKWALPISEMLAYKNAVAHENITFDYIVTDEFLYIGIVRNPDTDEDVILGPVSLMPLTQETINNIIVTYSLDDNSLKQMEEFFERTPTFSLNQFLNTMAMIHYELLGEAIDIFELYMKSFSDIEEEVGKAHTDILMDRKENENYHNTYFFEQEYYSFVERGDVEGLEQFVKKLPSFKEGSIAPNYIRQAKNIFVTSITLTTRRAISGGLDIETAYQLSDTYIQEMEKMSDATAITMLNNTAVFDFTKRVADAKIPNGMSIEIFKCIQYISNHINQDISVEDIAKYVNMDRSTLSKKFKRELGFNISSFITRRKLEEAKSLLHYSNRSISEISEYLCFSSQAYFQNVFKKKYGITPREYRMSLTKST